jgi:UDP-N-acetylmuramoylalanine--D-glutamate ligase
MYWPELERARLAIWGAGREGRAAWQALRRHHPQQQLTWLVRAEEGEPTRSIADASTDVIAGDIDLETLRRFEVVVKSPGISPYRAPCDAALAAGVRMISGSALWFAARGCARTLALTGTKGKSTTTALTAHLLRAAGLRVALFGNIGMPLLELLDPPQTPDWWVMELSSYQTCDLGAVPEIAVLLNLYPEHLDWHGSLARYYADKLRLFGTAAQHPRVAVLNAEHKPDLPTLPDTRWFGAREGFRLDETHVCFDGRRLIAMRELPLPGRHNALNVCAALTAVAATGVAATDLIDALRSFRPLPHRLQSLGVRDGVEWVNDSIATTPHATLAALEHYRERAVCVLLGGHDRGVDWQDFARAMRSAAPHALVLMGDNAARIDAALAEHAPHTRRWRVDTLEAALQRARAETPVGGVVLLSPGAPSFGMFRDYVARGRRFAELAGFDAERIASIEGLGL